MSDKGNDNDKFNIFNVTSHNQQGGITAGQVNIGPPTRDLNNASKVEKDAILSKLAEHRGKSFSVTVATQDSETMNFAYQMREFLENNGFDVGPSVATGFFSAPQPPMSISSRSDDDVDLIIGANNPNWDK